MITIDAPTTAQAGNTFSFLVRIAGTTAIAGYDLDLRINPVAGSTGSLMGNVALTNLYLSENLIEQGGNGVGGSLIQSLMPANPGLLVEAFDLNFAAVAVPGPGQDVLAEVFLTASGNASGDFEIELGPNTLLAIDANSSEDYEPALVTVNIPEPGYLGILSGLAALLMRRRRQA
ncbi:MAG: hypothetical protein H6817_06725 [Phycisphaerales bacterium]|nr:hypothetical protein [Phycisphaerales bacterium]